MLIRFDLNWVESFLNDLLELIWAVLSWCLVEPCWVWYVEFLRCWYELRWVQSCWLDLSNVWFSWVSHVLLELRWAVLSLFRMRWVEMSCLVEMGYVDWVFWMICLVELEFFRMICLVKFQSWLNWIELNWVESFLNELCWLCFLNDLFGWVDWIGLS